MRAWFVAPLVVAIGQAETWHVPEEVLTIQAALDSTADRDTVCISIGEYAEALIAPPHFVYLIGDTATVADSVLRPIIDPAPLDSSTYLSCLTVPAGSSASMERLVLRNGERMYPRERTGGVKYATYDSVIVRDCLFDSVHSGLFPYDFQARPRFIVERCEFMDMRGPCGNLRGPALIRDCLVHGNSVSGFGVFDSSVVENCRFTGTTENGWLESYRHDTMIRNNVFGSGTHVTPVIVVVSRGGADSVLNNVINCTGIAWKMMVSAGEGSPVVIRGNFITDTSASPGRVASLFRDYDIATDSLHVVFSDNVVTGGGDMEHGTKAVDLTGHVIGVEISHNRFINIPGGGPAIAVDSNAYHHTIRFNYISGTTYAVESWSAYTLDARLNWWGDSTGPYHATLNPGGLGDSLDSRHPIEFDPWWTDTMVWSTSEDRLTALPEKISLAVFPNPANANVTVALFSPQRRTVDLKIYNILGREVRTLWTGSADRYHTWNFDFETLATGIYFIRVVELDGTQLASERIVLLK